MIGPVFLYFAIQSAFTTVTAAYKKFENDYIISFLADLETQAIEKLLPEET
jgi:hypothetical protein